MISLRTTQRDNTDSDKPTNTEKKTSFSEKIIEKITDPQTKKTIKVKRAERYFTQFLIVCLIDLAKYIFSKSFTF